MPRIPALIVKASLTGCAVAGLFVLADASARMQLQHAVSVSGINLKSAAEILRRGHAIWISSALPPPSR